MSRSRHKDHPAGSPALETYLREIQEDPLLSAAEERALAEAIRRGDDEAAERLIRSNLRLVVKIARDYLGRGLGLDDLVGEGNLGLIRAARDYDPRFGTRFSTYAAYWIKQAIRAALVNTTATIRLPAHMVNLLTRWRRTERALTRALGEAPGPEQVASALGLTAAQRELVEHAQRAGRLMHEGQGRDGSAWTSDEAPDPREAAEDQLAAAEERIDLFRRLDRLDARERTILALRFGLEGQTPMTLKEVGRRLGVTREWVRKIEQRAVRKLEGAAGGDRPRPDRASDPIRRRRPARALQAV